MWDFYSGYSNNTGFGIGRDNNCVLYDCHGYGSGRGNGFGYNDCSGGRGCDDYEYDGFGSGTTADGSGYEDCSGRCE